MARSTPHSNRAPNRLGCFENLDRPQLADRRRVLGLLIYTFVNPPWTMKALGVTGYPDAADA